MNTQMLLLLSGVLQTLATVARTPSFSSQGYDYADLLDLAARLIQRGDEAIGELEALKREVDEMLASNTKPSPERIASWRQRSDAAHAELQALKTQEPKPQEPKPQEPEAAPRVQTSLKPAGHEEVKKGPVG